MTQYLMKPDAKAKELLYALKNYSCDRIIISAFSLGKRRGMNALGSNVDYNLELKVSDVWDFYINNKEFIKIFPDENQLFKLEYQDHSGFRIYPYFEDPNDSRMVLPAHSVFRNVIDNYLLEIWFKGKIPLEKDTYKQRKDFWKIKR